jgi:transposase
MQPTIIGLDLAKHVFQVHGVAADGQVVLRRQVRLVEVLPIPAAVVVGMEACVSAHYWARQLSALGHTVALHEIARFAVVASGVARNVGLTPAVVS